MLTLFALACFLAAAIWFGFSKAYPMALLAAGMVFLTLAWHPLTLSLG